MNLYLQYGSGFCAPPGWLNFDASPTLRFERIPLIGKLYTKNKARFPPNVKYGDITTGLPVEHDSCLGIYSSHVLEHLSRRDCETALRNTLKYLAPGGIFRLVVPDLEQLARTYLSGSSPDASHTFMAQSGLGEECHRHGVAGLISRAFGYSQHLWLWDGKAMVRQLELTGFRRVRKCQFNDCEDARFQEVEEQGRFVGCLAIEARK